MPTRYEHLRLFKLLEGLENGSSPSLLTVTPEKADAFTHPVVYEEDFDRHITTLNTEKFPETFDFTSEAETFDITPADKASQKNSLATAYEKGEIDEMTYLDALNSVDESEEFEGRFLHTIWKTNYLLSQFPYKREEGLQVPLPLSYRDIDDHHETMGVHQAEVNIYGFLIKTSLVHLLRDELAFDNSIVRITMPYTWSNSEDGRGAGDIEMVFNLASSTIQVFFQKDLVSNYPLFTSSYTINVRTGLNRVKRDDLITSFQTPMINQGDAIPPRFEDIEEFLFSLIELASDYTTRALQLSFALMLSSYSCD